MRQMARFICCAEIRCGSSCTSPETKGQILVFWYPLLWYCVCPFLPLSNIAVHHGKPNICLSPETAEGTEWQLAWISNGNPSIYWETVNKFSEGSSKPKEKGKRMLFYFILLSLSFPFTTSSDFTSHKTWSRIAGSWKQATISFWVLGNKHRSLCKIIFGKQRLHKNQK